MRLRTLALVVALSTTSALAQVPEPGSGFHVTSFQLELTPNLTTKTVTGSETIQLTSLVPALSTITFSGNALTIDSATANGHPLTQSQTAKTLSFELPQPRKLHASATLQIKYHGTPKQGVVFTPASVYTTYFACDWMICSEDAPGDKATFSLDLHVPAGMTSLAVGELTSKSKLKDGAEIHHWRVKRPYSAYLYDFAIGNYAVATTHVDGDTLTYLSEIAIPAELASLFADTAPMVQFLTAKAGVELPGRSYAQLLVPGKEAQETVSYSIIGRDYLTPTDDWAIIHELSHQWWGNLITCATWKDFWLNEGITSFMVDAWKEHHYGRASYDAALAITRKAIEGMQAKGMKDYPLAYGGDYPNIRERRAIQYGKGELFMDHLRTLLGEETFWSGLRSYTRKYAGVTVTSIDFERSMEAASGRDLSSVFAEWVFEKQP